MGGKNHNRLKIAVLIFLVTLSINIYITNITGNKNTNSPNLSSDDTTTSNVDPPTLIYQNTFDIEFQSKQKSFTSTRSNVIIEVDLTIIQGPSLHLVLYDKNIAYFDRNDYKNNANIKLYLFKENLAINSKFQTTLDDAGEYYFSIFNGGGATAEIQVVINEIGVLVSEASESTTTTTTSTTADSTTETTNNTNPTTEDKVSFLKVNYLIFIPIALIIHFRSSSLRKHL